MPKHLLPSGVEEQPEMLPFLDDPTRNGTLLASLAELLSGRRRGGGDRVCRLRRAPSTLEQARLITITALRRLSAMLSRVGGGGEEGHGEEGGWGKEWARCLLRGDEGVIWGVCAAIGGVFDDGGTAGLMNVAVDGLGYSGKSVGKLDRALCAWLSGLGVNGLPDGLDGEDGGIRMLFPFL